MSLFRANLRALFVIWSFSGAVRLGRALILSATFPGEVKRVDWDGELVMVFWLSDTSGRSGPWFGENWSSKTLVKSSARSWAAYTGPFSPVSGRVAGFLLRKFCLVCLEIRWWYPRSRGNRPIYFDCGMLAWLLCVWFCCWVGIWLLDCDISAISCGDGFWWRFRT